MAELRIALLGPPRVERDGAPIEVDTRKAIAMLAYLAIHPERHGRDAVAGLLWPDYDTEHARGAAAHPVHPEQGRRAGVAGRGPDHRRVRPDGLLAGRDPFRGAAGRLPGPRPPARRRLPGLPGPAGRGGPAPPGRLPGRVQPARQHQLRRLAVLPGRTAAAELAGTLERLATAQIGQRRWDDAVDAARRWLALDPLHEPAHRQLMRIYSWSGRRGAALRQFQACQRVLEEELGVEPWRRSRSTRRSRPTGFRRPRADRRPAGRRRTAAPAPAAASAPGLDSRGQPASGSATLPLRGAEPGAGSLKAAPSAAGGRRPSRWSGATRNGRRCWTPTGLWPATGGWW